MNEFNLNRIDELTDLIFDSMVEEVIFMEEIYHPSHYMLLDNLTELDKERILLINTCESYRANNKNYHVLLSKEIRDITKESCVNLIRWEAELLSIYEDELKRIGLGSYEYNFDRVVNLL